MAQENEEVKKGNVFQTLLKVLIGLVFIAIGVYLIIIWKDDIFILLKGCAGLFLVMTGAITLAIAKE